LLPLPGLGRALEIPIRVAFLRGLPLRHEDGGVLYVHAKAYALARWEYLRSRVQVGRSLAATDASPTVCGHVPEPML
jgi:hypothetical protein